MAKHYHHHRHHHPHSNFSTFAPEEVSDGLTLPTDSGICLMIITATIIIYSLAQGMHRVCREGMSMVGGGAASQTASH